MRKISMLAASVLISLLAYSQNYQVFSPDGKLKAEIEINRNINVNLTKEGIDIIKLGNISLEKEEAGLKKAGIKVQRVIRKAVNEIIIPEIREKAASIENVFNEMEIRFGHDMSITFRLYNEGLAYRFSTSSKESLIIYRENLSIMLGNSDSVRFQSSKSFNSAYETPYEHDGVSGIQQGKLCNLPFLVKKDNGPFVMITEADLYDYPGLWLKGTGESMLTAVNPPFPETFTDTGSAYGIGQVKEANDFIAMVRGTRTYPWRILP